MSTIILPDALPDVGAAFDEPDPAKRVIGVTRRWWLGRCVCDPDNMNGGRGRLLVIAMQPSTADEKQNDPTILREIGFAYRWGFRFLDKVNLFDLCSPDPETLYGDRPPVTDENDRYVFAAAQRATLILCAWGNHGAHLARGARMKRLLLEAGYKLHVYGIGGVPLLTLAGYPIHTLARGKSRVPDIAEPVEWR